MKSLSIVIPAYNASRHIEAVLERARAAFVRRALQNSGEDDGREAPDSVGAGLSPEHGSKNRGLPITRL